MSNKITEQCLNIAQLFYNNGIRNICISPGLRNSALSLAFINNEKFTCYSILDERTSGYFALGMGLKTNIPSILICTSGTAVANYLPAVIEGSQSKIPMIILTADRPPYLLNLGENQTINQANIYGDFVRSSLHINKDDHIQNWNEIENQINDIIQLSMGDDYKNHKKTPLGPVHINIHLMDFSEFNLPESKYSLTSEDKTIIFEKNEKTHLNLINSLNESCDFTRTLIVIGRLNKKIDKNLIMKLSSHLNAPVLVDSLSQIRYDNSIKRYSLYDFYVHCIKQPTFIIRIGQKPVSKVLSKLLSENTPENTLLIDPFGLFNDDCRLCIKENYGKAVELIVDNIQKVKVTDNESYISHVTGYENNINQQLKQLYQMWQDNSTLTELMITAEVLFSIDDDYHFFIGNSMPIRYLDMMINYPNAENIHTYSNRGASGIDGVVSTALGVSKSSKKETVLLIGDLSFIHDQNSLLIANQYDINITIIIINNNGGGIFSLLPISNSIDKDVFEQYWTTPQNIDFKKLAELYNATYKRVENNAELQQTLSDYKNIDGIKIIDAIVDVGKHHSEIKKIKDIKKGQ